VTGLPPSSGKSLLSWAQSIELVLISGGRECCYACYLLHAGFCLAYSSTLKMEATCSSKMSVDFQRTKVLYIPEHRTLHNRRCDNLKSYKIYLFVPLAEFLHSQGKLCPIACVNRIVSQVITADITNSAAFCDVASCSQMSSDVLRNILPPSSGSKIF
jgi:hypothetical protein